MWHKHRTSILIGCTFSLLLSMFWFFPSLAFIIFISLLLSLLLNSFVEKFSKKIPRVLSAAIVLLTFLALIIGFLAMVSRSFIPTFTKFIADIPEITNNLQLIPDFLLSDFINQELDSLLKELTSFSVTALKSSLTIIISLFSKVLDIILIIFVTFYLLKDGEEIKMYLAKLFPHKDYFRVLSLFDNILRSLKDYIKSQIVICVLTGIIVFLYFTLMGLPYASVFAVLSGISEFVPVIGPTLASTFGVLLTATQAPLLALKTMVFYIVLTQLNHNFIYPYLIGKSLNLHPVAIILSIIFGGELLGATGMFLAVPCTVIIKLVIEDIHRDRVIMLKKEPKGNEFD